MTFLVNFKLQCSADGKLCADAARLDEQTARTMSQGERGIRALRCLRDMKPLIYHVWKCFNVVAEGGRAGKGVFGEAILTT